MTEAGGPSTQAGIYYQNSVAALYLAELLELEPAPRSERVVFVRVEAPTDVDDIVVHYADGHCKYLSAKLSLHVGNQAWVSLWKSVLAQVAKTRDREGDQVIIAVAEHTDASRDLKALCERANTSTDAPELARRLTSSQTKLLERIGADCDAPFELLRRVSLQALSLEQIEEHLALRRLGRGATRPATMLSILRDLAGGLSRSRAVFRAPAVRRMLAEEHGINLSEPIEWGARAYREAVEGASRIEVPATGLSGPAAAMFVWPRVCEWQRHERSDFEDEWVLQLADPARVAIDLKTFPSDQLHRCVIVAGPGYGKSALLTAIAARLAVRPVLPVLVPLASLAASDVGIQDFLNEHVNHDYDVRIDWRRLAEQGLVALLLDGLDEVPSAARPALLDKLRAFSARYKQVPWLLTVRDPAVLTGALDTRTLEILPLDDGDIARFAQAMEKHYPRLRGSQLVEHLERHADLQRLARIPLFLVIMLATVQTGDEIPASRSELIERYLHTLFAPSEHKSIPGPVVSPTLLRAIAARLAFERLEKGEIGVSTREVEIVIEAFVARREDIDSVKAALLAYGVLRRQSSIRLQFPFPIVQEYLAAIHLLEHAAGTLPARVDDAIQRPWAQVLQFALELHPQPAPVMREILARPDDAFDTNLRLVGRCIVNGARVDAPFLAEVGSRLIHQWVHAPHYARERLGRLIVDGFAQPLSPALREALHSHWLFNSGVGDILTQQNDRALTLSVLEVLVQRHNEHDSFYHSLKPAISAVGDEAFDRLVEVAKKSGSSGEKRSRSDSLLYYLTSGSVARERALEAARDVTLPTGFRLNCYRIAGPPLPPEATQLLQQVFGVEDHPGIWCAVDLISLSSNVTDHALDVLRDSGLPLQNRVSIVARLGHFFDDPAARDSALNKCANDPTISEEVREVAMLFAARHGDRVMFEKLIERLPTITLDIAAKTIAIFGHHPSRALAERAATLIENRVLSCDEMTQIASSANIGMLYVYRMDFGFGGELADSPPHAGALRWAQLLEAWSDRAELNDTQRLNVLTAAAGLGSNQARVRLAEIIRSMDPDDPRYAVEDKLRHELGAAIQASRRHAPLPLSVAERLARAKAFNVANQGIAAIAAHANTAALDMLLEMHAEETEWHLKNAIEATIEMLSAQLSIFIRRDGEVLIVGSYSGAH